MDDDDVELYIAKQPEKQQEYLRQMQTIITDVAPSATTSISYQIPAYWLDGKILVYISAWKSHVSMYPIPPAADELQMRMKPYIAGKGTLKFMLDSPLPTDIVRDIVMVHMERLKNK